MDSPILYKEILLHVDELYLESTLVIPENCKGLLLFALSKDMEENKEQTNLIADYFQDQGFGTLAVDFFTQEDEAESSEVHDQKILTYRLEEVTKWLKTQSQTKDLPLAYFSGGNGSTATLVAAATFGNTVVKAIVCFDGRPDLVGAMLPLVKSPTLMLVGSLNQSLLELNESPFSLIGTPEKKLEILPESSYLSQGKEEMTEVAKISSKWFKKYLL